MPFTQNAATILHNAGLTNYQFIYRLANFEFIKRVYLFGSRARGDHHSRSDIDLAIECSEASLQDWAQVVDFTEHADTLLAIDCVRLDTLKDNDLKNRIFTEGQLLYEREDNY